MKNKNYCMALLAHVDAGKTTLSESILFNTGSIRKAGRVDHGDCFLDTEAKERERGITIFSKQALFNIGENNYTLIDTPGHTDFSAEMERALSVLDFAVLIISAPDGIHGHDLTLWRLLDIYKIPAVIFVNKTDQPGADCAKVMKELTDSFGTGCVDFSAFRDAFSNTEICNEASAFDFENDNDRESFYESVAVLDEALMEHYFEHGGLGRKEFIRLFRERRLFPCCFGSALKNEGVNRLLGILAYLSEERAFPEEFAARVFKVTRDRQGKRLTHIRITGGSIRPKENTCVNKRSGAEQTTEKINRIIRYSGAKSEQLEYAEAGMAVSVEGIESAVPGDTLGAEKIGSGLIMTPLFSSGVSSEDVPDVHRLYNMLKELEAEIPEISIGFNEHSSEASLKLMGEVQTDIIKAIVKERFDISLDLTPARIVYKETIAEPVICAGHYEPLRHYAEVHLLMEPAERGSGIEICTAMSEDELPRHFQRLIMTNIAEKKHIGVLTGAELTDVRITLINARSHEKHTEGGDFRQAVRRAVRYGLMKLRADNGCMLLEPFYEFELAVPDKSVGRAMNDLSALADSFTGPEPDNGMSVFKGRAAVSRMRDYAAAVAAYTGGFGRLSLSFAGYDKCKNTDEVVAGSAYDPELDLDNQSGSVFCSHGAGYYVPWYEADAYFHLDLRAEEEWLKALNVEKSAKIYDIAEKYSDNTEYLDSTQKKSVKSAAKTSGAAAGGLEYDGNAAVFTAAGAGSDSMSAASSKNVSGKGGRAAKQDTDYMGAGLKADRELEEIFLRSLSGNRRNDQERPGERRKGSGAFVRKPPEAASSQKADASYAVKPAKKQYLLVDGYNIIFAWDELKELAAVNIDSARAVLQDILANYQGFKGMTLILVFDAYKVKGNHGSIEKYHNIYVVYTKEAQTADAYIEAAVHEMGRRERVTVATSDGLEQTIVFGEGAVRMSARELYNEVMTVQNEIRDEFLSKTVKLGNTMTLDQSK